MSPLPAEIKSKSQRKLDIPIQHTPDNIEQMKLSEQSNYMTVVRHELDRRPLLHIDLTKMPEPKLGLHNISVFVTNNYSRARQLTFQIDIRESESLNKVFV